MVTANDYYPGGMLMPGRKYSSTSGYRYGFNGKENDNTTGEGNLDFGARIYNGRLGRFLSVDPLTTKYPDHSPFVFAFNNPLLFIDPDGRDNIVYIYAVDGSLSIKQLKAMAKQATANYVYNGINVQVKVLKGKVANLDKIKLDPTDAVAIIGNRENVINMVEKSNPKWAEYMRKTQFGGEGKDGLKLHPETAQDGSDPRYGNSGTQFFAIGTEALTVTANTVTKTSLTETGGYILYHSTGHLAGLSDDYIPDGDTQGMQNIMSSGPIVSYGIEKGKRLSDYVKSPDNTMKTGTGNDVKYNSSIYKKYAKKFSAEKPVVKNKVEE